MGIPRSLRTLGSEDGVAMTEAVIVLPVLLLLFLACYYFHGAFRASLVAHREAETSAWARANSEDCVDGAEAQRIDDLEEPTAEDGEAIPMPAGSEGLWRYVQFSQAAERTQSVPRMLGNTSGEFSIERRVALPCNEQPQSDMEESFVALLGLVVSQVTGIASLF